MQRTRDTLDQLDAGRMEVNWGEDTFWKLPEIAYKIQSYLSTSDLLSCTGVNPVWEGQARRRLLQNGPSNPARLNWACIGSYMRNRRQSGCHTAIEFQLQHTLGLGGPQGLITYGGEMSPQLLSFIEKYSQKVKHLSIYVPELDVCAQVAMKEGLGLRLARSFPVLATLTVWNCPEPFLVFLGEQESLASLSLLTDAKEYNPTLFSLLPFHGPTLTRLEFSLPSSFLREESASVYCSNWVLILSRMAPTLKQLSIQGWQAVWGGTRRHDIHRVTYQLILPSLPKLEQLEVSFTPSVSGECGDNGFKVGLGFEATSIEELGECRIKSVDHAKQFPVLRSLCLQAESEARLGRRWERNLDIFEAVGSFMHATFVGYRASVCGTLSHLNVPWLAREEWCRCGRVFDVCDCWKTWEWKEYYHRLQHVFPNAVSELWTERKPW